ncbi:MAG TPA: tryptophan--tRNA ligase [bacterium]|nr:tryptophan--tRNA ligase [bacterium]
MRVLSGIQPSGRLHLGNYFGAIKQHIELQAKNECFYFIADYHALTTVRKADDLRKFSQEVAIDYLALGIDPQKTVFFRQSDVPEVPELTWILTNLMPLGLLERCHSYKDKIAHGVTPHLGVFAYPVLMAADILIYKPDLVPVGKDQKQHIEVTRDLAIKFNTAYGELFKIPEPHILPQYAVIPGVDGQKMSKSYKNTIDIFCSEAELRKRVMSIKTDSTPVEQPKDHTKCSLFALYELFATPDEKKRMEDIYRKGGTGYGAVKEELFGKIRDYFKPYHERRNSILADPAYVATTLREGAGRARDAAGKTLREVKKAVGII